MLGRLLLSCSVDVTSVVTDIECNNRHWQLIQDDAYRRRRVLLAMDQRIFL